MASQTLIDHMSNVAITLDSESNTFECILIKILVPLQRKESVFSEAAEGLLNLCARLYEVVALYRAACASS